VPTACAYPSVHILPGSEDLGELVSPSAQRGHRV